MIVEFIMLLFGVVTLVFVILSFTMVLYLAICTDKLDSQRHTKQSINNNKDKVDENVQKEKSVSDSLKEAGENQELSGENRFLSQDGDNALRNELIAVMRSKAVSYKELAVLLTTTSQHTFSKSYLVKFVNGKIPISQKKRTHLTKAFESLEKNDICVHVS